MDTIKDFIQEEGKLPSGRLKLRVDPDIYTPRYMDEMRAFCDAEKEKNSPRRKQLQMLFENESDPREKRRHKQQLDAFLKEQLTMPAKCDQFCVECAYQFMKLDIQAEYGFFIEIHIRSDGGRKGRWALVKHPEGRGAFAATEGRGARRLYKAIRSDSHAHRAGIHV